MKASLVLVLLGLSLCLSATAATPPPNCEGNDYRAFDFWLGEWEVRAPNGQLAGSNRISAQEGGCLLLEQWQNTGGGTGQSYNYYDRGDQQWHQLWVSRGAIIDYAGGLTATGSMRLEGEITYQSDGRKAPFTGEWTANADGSVQQVFKEWNAESKQWQDWFTGIYTRKPAPPAASE